MSEQDILDTLADSLIDHYDKTLTGLSEGSSIAWYKPESFMTDSKEALETAKTIVNEAAIVPGNRLWENAIANNKASCVLRMCREWAVVDMPRMQVMEQVLKELRSWKKKGLEARIRGIKQL